METLARLTPYSVAPMARLLRTTAGDLPWGATLLLLSAIAPESTRAALLRQRERGRDVAWLYLVKNPPHHPKGDFALNNFSVANDGEPRYTFSGIGVYRTEMFDSVKPGQSAQIAPILREYAARGQVGGEIYRGDWTDVGTPQRLAQLNGE